MKKFLKIILILAVLVVLLLVIGGIVITRPGFQKSVFLSAMEGSVDSVQVETLQAGTSKVAIKGLDIEQNGAIVKLGDLTLNYSLWDYIFDKEIRIDVLAIKGLYVDTTNMKPSEKSDKDKDDSPNVDGGVPEFKGIFENTEIPVKIFIGKVDIDGEVRMPNRQLTFALNGGDIAPGKEGNLTISGQLKDQTPGAAASQLSVNGALTLNQTTGQKLDNITFNGDISASGGNLTSPAKMTIALTAEKQAATETYAFTVSTNSQQLANLQSTFSPKTESLDGSFTANIDRADLAPFLMGADLPDFTLTMDEKFQLDGKADKFDVAGTLQLDLRNLAQWKPELADVGSGTLKATLKSTIVPKQVLLETLDANFVTADGRKLLAIDLKRKFTIKTVDGKPQLDGQPGELLSIALSNLPVDWLSPFAPNMKLSGDNISGAATFSGTDADSFSVKSTQPWQVGRLSVVKDGKPLLDSVDIQMTPDVAVKGKDLTVTVNNVLLASGTKKLIQGKFDLAANMEEFAKTTNVTLDLSGDLAKLQAQPMLAAYAGLAGGNYSLKANVVPGDSGMDIDATLALIDLTSKKTFVQLPSATLSVKGTVDGSDNINLQGPLVIKGVARTTDAQIVAKIDRTKGVNDFQLDITGNTLVYDQLNFLMDAFKDPNAVAKAAPPPSANQPKVKQTTVEPDKIAVWDGNQGEANLKFTKVYWDVNQVDNLEGKLVINAETLRLTPFKATLNGAPVELKTIIDFRKGNPKPYLFDASLDLQQLEVGTMLSKDGNPKNSSVTGPFTIKGSANGEAPTLGLLTESALFDFDLKGGPGIVRTLQQNNVVGVAAGGLSLVSSLAGLAGGDTISQNPGIQNLNALLDAISKEINYDQISFVADRKENLNINVQEFLLVSSTNNLKFKGNGGITYQAGVPMKQQPLVINSQIWTKGKQAELFNKIGILGQEKDKDGYQAGPRFDITGSMASVDYYSSLAKSLITNVPNLVGGLGGGALESIISPITGFGKDGQPTDQTKTEQTEKDKQNQEATNAVGGLLKGLLKPKQTPQQQQPSTQPDAPESGNSN
ncbi:hypothetical protein [Cerasicoccus arenae]|uniref:AsmA domain-containing protein n=1 Tax=Cerasicoccus arenae TaxID=424488 RepID=A0A8J3DG19_9BACT|nr:hypothetical protein [Cerasicoccus arenae]MBK1858012.1 hypothetical protein [Cerasicoccus arenae]GHB97473.1 hypothetical protein GCM10007047_11610 [Cerasicoccus arenae]